MGWGRVGVGKVGVRSGQVGWGGVGVSQGRRGRGEWGWVGYLWSNYECFPISGCKDIDF